MERIRMKKVDTYAASTAARSGRRRDEFSA
jgi:hypothetical protein